LTRYYLSRVLGVLGLVFCGLAAYWSAKDDPRHWTSLGLGLIVVAALLVMALLPPRR